MMALIQKVCIVLLAAHTAHAFLLPRASLPPSTTALEQQVLRATGTSSTPQFNLRYGELPPQEGEAERLNRQKRWEAEYLAYVKFCSKITEYIGHKILYKLQRNGAHLCAMSWRGYQAEGRGAILAKYEDQDMDQEGKTLSEVDRVSGVPSMYVSLARWMESGEAAKDGPAQAERQDLQQILDRVISYEPERAFVVVFQAHGLMGADIVTPNVSPPDMAEKLMAKESDLAPQTIDVDGHEVLVDQGN